jgi:hypothetical protein
MGMIHLLGINTPIDFKKASFYLGHQSLNDAPDANRLLGFIANRAQMIPMFTLTEYRFFTVAKGTA